MAVSYSYLFTGTTDIIPNTKYKSRLTLDVTQTGDIWNTYYGPMKTVAIHSNDRGYSYIQSIETKQYLSRNNYGALVWWADATPNYSDWLISNSGDSAYKTTLLNLKENQHSYLVWNKDDGSTNWWSSSAGNDTWKTYWGLTSDLPEGKYRISCGNKCVIREPRVRVYYGRTTSVGTTTFYIIDEEGFDPNNPITQYRYYSGGAWKYLRGGFGDDTTFGYSYIQMNYTLNRATNVGTSYSDSFNPQDFYWIRKNGTVSYLDILNTLDVTFVGQKDTRTVYFQPVDVEIPIKNAKQEANKQLSVTFKTGGAAASTAFVSSEVTCTVYGNIQINSFSASPFQMSKIPTTSWTPELSYTILYDVNNRVYYNGTYYNAYVVFRYSYVGGNNNMNFIYNHLYQQQNPLYGLFSYDETVSYIGKGEFTSEIELPSGLTYVSYTAPFKNSYVKFREIAETDEGLEVTTYGTKQSTMQSAYLGLNLSIGDDKTATYPALHTFTLLESLQALNVPINPYKYSNYTINGSFKHLEQDKNSFVDVAVYKSPSTETSWVKKNDFKVYLNNDNVFKFPLKDVLEPLTPNIPVQKLDQSLHTDVVYKFEYSSENSLYLAPLFKYNLQLGSSKTDLTINEEPRKLNTNVYFTNRTHDFYKGCPLFLSGATTLGEHFKGVRFKITYSNGAIILPVTYLNENLPFRGYFNAMLVPTSLLDLNEDQFVVHVDNNYFVEEDVYDINYAVKDTCGTPYLVYYLNSLGGVDVIPLNECTVKSVSTTQSTYSKKETVKVNNDNTWLKNYSGSLEEVDELTTPYDIKTTTEFACKTPFLDEAALTLHSELFDSMQVFLYKVASKEFIPVVVSTNSYSIKSKKQNSGKPVQMSFTLTEAITEVKTI